MENNIFELAQELSKKVYNWIRFGYCQAWTSNVIDGRYILIKSYHTIVGIVDCKNKNVYELGKYSRTTSKQFTRIVNSMFVGYERKLICGGK